MSDDISDESTGMVILAGTSHPNLCKLISSRLGIKLGKVGVYRRANTETAIDIKQVTFLIYQVPTIFLLYRVSEISMSSSSKPVLRWTSTMH